MRVWEFLDFFAASYGIARQKRMIVIDDLLQLLDLGHKRNEAVQSLSRGMRQRLCLAKTLVHDPPVLVLDEPASGLDPRARLEIKELLRELGRMGKTILISSHILHELADVCNKVGFIERGQLLAHGPIDKIYRQIRAHHLLDIRAPQEHDTALENLLSRAPDIGASRREGPGHFVVDHTGTDAGLSDLLRRLIESGIPVTEFHQRPVNLEEAFIKITKGDVI